MKLSLPTLALALAATVAAQFTNQSVPFNLVLVSENKTIDGQYLAACHEGAAIEGLCLAGIPSPSQPDPIIPVTYNFNTSDSEVVPNATLGASGYITYELRGGNFNESEALGLYYNPSSNVALPLFYPGSESATSVAFDSNNFLNIQNYIDDTQSPPKAGTWVAFYRWYACTTYYTGYTYNTLAWVVGEAPPQNPTCVKVSVKRVFV